MDTVTYLEMEKYLLKVQLEALKQRYIADVKPQGGGSGSTDYKTEYEDAVREIEALREQLKAVQGERWSKEEELQHTIDLLNKQIAQREKEFKVLSSMIKTKDTMQASAESKSESFGKENAALRAELEATLKTLKSTEMLHKGLINSYEKLMDDFHKKCEEVDDLNERLEQELKIKKSLQQSLQDVVEKNVVLQAIQDGDCLKPLVNKPKTDES